MLRNLHINNNIGLYTVTLVMSLRAYLSAVITFYDDLTNSYHRFRIIILLQFNFIPSLWEKRLQNTQNTRTRQV